MYYLVLGRTKTATEPLQRRSYTVRSSVERYLKIQGKGHINGGSEKENGVCTCARNVRCRAGRSLPRCSPAHNSTRDRSWESRSLYDWQGIQSKASRTGSLLGAAQGRTNGLVRLTKRNGP